MKPDYVMTQAEQAMMARADAQQVLFAYGDDEHEAAERLVDAGYLRVKRWRWTDDYGFELVDAAASVVG